MFNYESDDWNIKSLFQEVKIAFEAAEYKYKIEIGDDFAEKFKEEIIKYGRKVYGDYQTKLQEAHEILPEQYARRLDELLQKINELNPYKNEPTSLDLSSWMDVFNSTFVYGLMTDIINSIIKHAKGDEIKKIPDVLEYLSKPKVYKTLLETYIKKYVLVGEKNKDKSSYKKLKQIKYLKKFNNTRKYMKATQNFFQEAIKSLKSPLQDASKYIEDTIAELFHNNEKEFIEKIKSVLREYDTDSS